MALGYKLDIVFYQIRIGLFYLDNDLITRNIDKAKTWVIYVGSGEDYFYVLSYIWGSVNKWTLW